MRSCQIVAYSLYVYHMVPTLAREKIINAPTEWIGTGKDEIHIANEKVAFMATPTSDENSRRAAGVYFSFMEDVWDDTNAAPINAADFECIR